MKLWSTIARLALLASLVGVSPAVLAGGFQVTPTIAEIAVGGKIASFQLHNNGNEPVSVQADAFAWSQDGKTDQLAPATDVVISPRIATLAPGGSALVRVALRSPAPDGRAFRLKLRELPPPATNELNGVRTLIEHNIPLFFLANGTASLDLHAQADANGVLQVVATNSGARHYRSTSVAIVDASGATIVESKGPRYALPHSTTRWPLPSKGIVRGSHVLVRTTGADGLKEFALIVE